MHDMDVTMLIDKNGVVDKSISMCVMFCSFVCALWHGSSNKNHNDLMNRGI